MRASFAILAAAAAAPAYGFVARGQDSSNFLADTAPQGYTQLISQIDDGQPQAPTAAPPVDYPVPTSVEVPIVPTETPPAVDYPVPTSVEIPTSVPQVTLPVETTPVAPPPVETPPVVTPPVVTPPVVPTVVVPPVPTTLVVESSSIVAPPATTPTPPAEPPSNGASSLQALSSFGLVAVAAAFFLA